MSRRYTYSDDEKASNELINEKLISLREQIRATDEADVYHRIRFKDVVIFARKASDQISDVVYALHFTGSVIEFEVFTSDPNGHYQLFCSANCQKPINFER